MLRDSEYRDKTSGEADKEKLTVVVCLHKAVICGLI